MARTQPPGESTLVRVGVTSSEKRHFSVPQISAFRAVLLFCFSLRRTMAAGTAMISKTTIWDGFAFPRRQTPGRSRLILFPNEFVTFLLSPATAALKLK